MNTPGSKTVLSQNPYIVLNNQGELLSIELNSRYHRLGRDPQQPPPEGLVVPESWGVMSRTQACFRKIGNDYYIYDGDGTNPSANKLFINNKIVTPQEGHQLKNGDELKIGQNPQNWITLGYFDPNSTQPIPKPVQKTISLKGRSVVLGRDAGATIQLEAPTVSRRHATIDLDAQGRYVLQDYSTNGVFVNGQKVNGSAVLTRGTPGNPGSSIRIGPYTLILQGDELVLVDQGDNIRVDAENIMRIVKDKNGKDLILLNNISLPIEPGQFVALVGGSGAGKSTLMRTLLGIEPTKSGKVYLNGDDLRSKFNIYRTLIGYVPQQDIVHTNLRVGEVLYYAAKLRLPADISEPDIERIIQKTLTQIEMTERRDTLVKDLSGGQLKRVSIGVELLADPKLFFLDEPTSGLDPGLDKKMMKLLRNLADEGRTIILVTHATTNITLCDRIVFLGRGGNLCYFGPPRESMKFFQLSDFADIYIKLEPKEAVFQEATRFRQSQYQQDYIDNRISTVKQPGNIEPQKVKRSFLQQLLILTQRYFKLVLRDPVNLTLSLLTAPIGIALITLAVRKQAPLAPDLTEFNDSIKAAPLALKVLFVFTCAALWVGFSTSLQEIVKEGAIYMRERLVNLGLFAYLGSKTIILGGLAILQAILMIAVILIGFKDPEPELIHWIGGASITIFLTLFAAMSLGLMVSAIAKNSTQANTALPILLLPQIIFSGVLFEVDKASKYISWLMISRWSVGAFGTLVDVNKMADKTMELRPPVPPNTEPIPIPFEGSPVYQVDWHNLALNWEILLLHTLIYLTVTFILQKRKDVL